MRQRIFLLIFLVLLIAALAGLNAISFTRKDKEPDSEFSPNRSTYNSGASGASAFYDLLAETGKKVTRWQQPLSALFSKANEKINTLVIVGETRKEVTEEEAQKILDWVSHGGRLVLIDRAPTPQLLNGSNWKLTALPSNKTFSYDDNANPLFLIDKVTAAKPVQPTTLMSGINAVQPSILASKIEIEYAGKDASEVKGAFKTGVSTPTPKNNTAAKQGNDTGIAPPKIAKKTADVPVKIDTDGPDAPVVHLSNPEKNILADMPYGDGRIIFLSDPYIVSNAGIRLVDNAILGLNLVATKDGTIAFDEYHQGFGSENTLLRYFSGTPIPALFAQALLIVLVLLWTQGKRFARPLPLPAKDRRSKLEYIGAMADLQQSSRAYDLAIENVYTQTKRDMMRLIGADNKTSKKQLAESVAERSGCDAKDLYILMSKCEDIIAGEPTNAKETIKLVSQLRELQEKLGFNRKKASSAKALNLK